MKLKQLAVLAGLLTLYVVPVGAQETKYETDPNVLKGIMSGGVPMGRWKEGLNFDGIVPMPWLKSAANFYPGTETLQPGEMRITFMGTSPIIRPGQMNTSIYVELGNGDSFVFDLGEGSVANYSAAGVPLNKINNIFLTHLHWDHVGALPYVYTFGATVGRWHEPFRVFGPSGNTPEEGVKHLVHHMQKMLNWHKDDFDITPIGRGWEIEVTEFDFRDDGGLIYDRNGVKVTHWRQSHGKDGASAYRLDWNGLSFVFSGDGRPNSLTAKYAKGVDVLVTELQQEVVGISSQVMGSLPFVARYTIDTHHNPGYAGGYLANQVKPRLYMTTHMNYDAYMVEETVAEVRHHWKGPYHMGAPDGIVVNVTKDKLWVREAVLPRFPNNAPLDVKASVDQYGGLVIPVPVHRSRDAIQEQSIRDAEISPKVYYPPGYQPELIQVWPTDKPLFIPVEQLPEKMKPRKPESGPK